MTSDRTRRSSRVEWAVSLSVIALLSVIGFYFGRMRTDDVQESLVVDQRSLDFGEVWLQRTLRWKLPIHNRSSRAIHLESINASCSCTSISPMPLTIPAGSTVQVEAVLDLTAGTTDGFAEEYRDLTIDLVPQTKELLPEQIRWQLTGRIRAPYRISPPQILFSKSIVRGQTPSAETAEIISRIPLKSLEASCTIAGAIVTLTRDEELPSRFLLSVRPADSLPAGSFRLPIELNGVTKTGEVLPPVRVLATGQLVNDIYAIPATVDFGITQVGKQHQETVTFQSRTGVEFQIDKIRPSDPRLRVEAVATEQISNRREIRIVAAYDKPGEYAGQVQISLLTSSGASSVMTIPVWAYVPSIGSRQP